MATTLKAGDILIAAGAALPASLEFESALHSSGWTAALNLNGFGMEKRVREAGWTFFYMADEIRAGSFGFDAETALSRAAGQVLKETQARRFNSLEITGVTSRRILGLFYATVSAHPRHIQESMVLFQANGSRNGTKLQAVTELQAA